MSGIAAPAIAFFALALGLVSLFFGLGYLAGFRGTWKHSVVAVLLVQGFFILPGLLQLIFFGAAPGARKGLGFTQVVLWLVIIGSLFGSLKARPVSWKNSVFLHLALAVGAFAVGSVLFRIF